MEFHEFPTQKFDIGKNIWKFNVSLLSNSSFVENIEQKWNYLINLPVEKDWKWWEDSKNRIKEIPIQFSRIISNNFRRSLNDLEKGTHQLDALQGNCEDSSLRISICEEKKVISH